MSFELPTRRTKVVARPGWSGAAFLIEAMLLLVFVMASLAVFTQMFAASSQSANQGKDLTDAVAIAAATAERFAADPQSVASEFDQGDLHIVCDIRSKARDGGTMYYATISVSRLDSLAGLPDDASPIYEVQTSKYESGV